MAEENTTSVNKNYDQIQTLLERTSDFDRETFPIVNTNVHNPALCSSCYSRKLEGEIIILKEKMEMLTEANKKLRNDSFTVRASQSTFILTGLMHLLIDILNRKLLDTSCLSKPEILKKLKEEWIVSLEYTGEPMQGTLKDNANVYFDIFSEVCWKFIVKERPDLKEEIYYAVFLPEEWEFTFLPESQMTPEQRETFVIHQGFNPQFSQRI